MLRIVITFRNCERAQVNLQVGLQCDDTPPGPFPWLGCLPLLNLRGWCCSTNETASAKTVGRGKEREREHQSLDFLTGGSFQKRRSGSKTLFMNQTKRAHMPRLSIFQVQNSPSLSLPTLDFSSSSKMALDALGGGGGGGLSLGRTGSCRTIPASAEGHRLAFHLTYYRHFTVHNRVWVQMLRQLLTRSKREQTLWIWH